MKKAPARFLIVSGLALVQQLSAQDIWESRPVLPQSSLSPSRSTYGGGKFLIFSTGATYWAGAAGTAGYTIASLPSTPSFYRTNGAATANGITIVSGSSNTLYTAPETSITGFPGTPITWTKQNPIVGRSADLFRVRHLNDRFIMGVGRYIDSSNQANSHSEVLTSTDGATWTSHNFPASTLGNGFFDIRDIAFKPGTVPGEGTWVFGTEANAILTAPENLSGASLVPITNLGSSPSLVFGSGVFVLATSNGRILSSPSGATGTWTAATLPVTMSSFGDIHFDGTTFVAVGARTPSNTSAILTSTNGSSWVSAPTQPSVSSATLATVLKADGLWVTAGLGRTVQTSGNSSIVLPAIDSHPAMTSGVIGGQATFSASAIGTPAPTYQWQKNYVAISDGPQPNGSIVSGATTNTLTITGLTFADAGDYNVRATNVGALVSSNAAKLSVVASSNGATLTPYAMTNTTGGTLIPGANPPAAVLTSGNPAVFTVGQGLSYLPGTSVSPTFYSQLGGTNPSGTKALLGPSSGSAPLAVYTLASQSMTVLPAPTLPLGDITSINYNMPVGLAENGDVTGIFQAPLQIPPYSQNHGYHFSAATQTYTLLGRVPNAGNDIASNPGGISSDGTTISGYERTGLFNGAFVWTTTGGFTLLPIPPNGAGADADIRGISPNGRFIAGYGSAHQAFGSGQTAIRWDRGNPLGAPVGHALQRRLFDTFADARTVNDDGTTVGNVRQGFSFNDNRAAVWLPDGKLIVVPDYLAATYNLLTPGFTLNQITSISADRRVLAGTATNSSNQAEGFIITLPEPLDVSGPADIAVRALNTDRVTGSSLAFTSREIGTPSYSQHTVHLRNDGQASLGNISITISGQNAGDFVAVPSVDPAPTTLGINQIIQLSVRFAPLPGNVGTRTAALTISSDDPDEAVFTLNLSGAATAPPAATFATWPQLSTVPENLRGRLDDPDGDGLANLIEYALGTAPGIFTAPPSAGETTVGSETYPTLTFTRRKNLTDVVLSVQISADLDFTTDLGHEPVTTIDNNNGTETVTVRSAVPRSSMDRQFLRLRVR